MQSAMQHDPSQSHSPDLPQEVLAKMSQIANVVIPDQVGTLPKAEPHCNCFYCQITRAIAKAKGFEEPETEEIPDEELEFNQWNIEQTGEDLFKVTSRIDETEQYSVFLGKPVGCTCGHEGCEHIIAVLKS